jgi:hypothetical protein
LITGSLGVTGSISATSTITGGGSTSYNGIASTAFGATATLGYGGVGSTGGTTFDIFQNGGAAIAVAQDKNVAIGAGSGNAAYGIARLLVKGSGTTSATTALLVQNANASASLTVKDNNTVVVGISTPPTTSLFAVYGNSTTSSIDAEIYRDFSAVSARGTATLRITTKNTTGNHGNQAIDFRHEGINSSPSSVTTARILNQSMDGGNGNAYFFIQTQDTSPYAGSLRTKIGIDAYGNIQLTDNTDAYVYLGNTYAYGSRTGKVITVAQQSNTGFTGDHLILRAGTPQNSSDRVGGNLILQGGQSTGTAASNILFQTIIPSGSSGTVTNSTYQTSMFISGSGNVGIGTSTPTNKLDIAFVANRLISFSQRPGYADYGRITFSNVTGADIASNGNINLIPGDTNEIISLGSFLTRSTFPTSSNYGAYSPSGVGFQVGSNKPFVFRNIGTDFNTDFFVFEAPNSGSRRLFNVIQGSTSYFTILPTGNVGINTTTDAGYKLDVNGTARVTTLIETSAAKYKTNIQPLDSQLSKVTQLEPVTFDWINKPNPKTNIGLIADEVEKIYPEFVSKTEDGEIEGIEYSKLTTVLIQSIKELKEIVDKQQEQINTLLNK